MIIIVMNIVRWYVKKYDVRGIVKNVGSIKTNILSGGIMNK